LQFLQPLLVFMAVTNEYLAAHGFVILCINDPIGEEQATDYAGRSSLISYIFDRTCHCS